MPINMTNARLYALNIVKKNNEVRFFRKSSKMAGERRTSPLYVDSLPPPSSAGGTK